MWWGLSSKSGACSWNRIFLSNGLGVLLWCYAVVDRLLEDNFSWCRGGVVFWAGRTCTLPFCTHSHLTQKILWRPQQTQTDGISCVNPLRSGCCSVGMGEVTSASRLAVGIHSLCSFLSALSHQCFFFFSSQLMSSALFTILILAYIPCRRYSISAHSDTIWFFSVCILHPSLLCAFSFLKLKTKFKNSYKLGFAC